MWLTHLYYSGLVVVHWPADTFGIYTGKMAGKCYKSLLRPMGIFLEELWRQLTMK